MRKNIEKEEEPGKERRKDKKRLEHEERESLVMKRERDKRKDRGRDQERLGDSERNLKTGDKDFENKQGREGDQSRGDSGREKKRSHGRG